MTFLRDVGYFIATVVASSITTICLLYVIARYVLFRGQFQ